MKGQIRSSSLVCGDFVVHVRPLSADVQRFVAENLEPLIRAANKTIDVDSPDTFTRMSALKFKNEAVNELKNLSAIVTEHEKERRRRQSVEDKKRAQTRKSASIQSNTKSS